MMRTAFRFSFIFAAVSLMSSCYITVQGSHYLYLRSKAVSPDRVFSDPKSRESTKDLLLRAGLIRRFAEEKLGLKDTKNYKSIVEMDADRLATIVSACDPLSFDRYLWSYPVVGALPYKGFFKIEEAEREASRLKAKDLDVIIRPVDAFSTLGWFADPLFSFMSKYDDAELAETIIHELAHATVFVKKAEQFNEEFATFVGRQGALAYIESVYGRDSPRYIETILDREDSVRFAAFLRGTAERLERVYALDEDRTKKLELKKNVISARAVEYRDTEAPKFHSQSYREFPMEKINNAYLDLYRLYEGEPELYKDYCDKAFGGDLASFIRGVERLADMGGDPKERMRRSLSELPR